MIISIKIQPLDYAQRQERKVRVLYFCSFFFFLRLFLENTTQASLVAQLEKNQPAMQETPV